MLRVLAMVAAVLGGGCWVVRWGADLAGDDPEWGAKAHWAGLALLGVAIAVVGAGLVSRSAVWLRIIVGVAAPLLVWSVYAVVRGDGEGILLDGVVGVLAIVAAVAMMVHGPFGVRSDASRGHGAHSAR